MILQVKRDTSRQKVAGKQVVKTGVRRNDIEKKG